MNVFYRSRYVSPLGDMVIVCDNQSVKGIWFEDQKHYGSNYELSKISNEKNDVNDDVETWLDSFFLRKNPVITSLKLAPDVTEFQKEVLDILMEIPYGKLISYKEVADKISQRRKDGKTSARAVGGAVGRNPISIIIPCHRVIGSDGSLTGYAGGIDRKIELLSIEGIDKNVMRQKNE